MLVPVLMLSASRRQSQSTETRQGHLTRQMSHLDHVAILAEVREAVIYVMETAGSWKLESSDPAISVTELGPVASVMVRGSGRGSSFISFLVAQPLRWVCRKQMID